MTGKLFTSQGARSSDSSRGSPAWSYAKLRGRLVEISGIGAAAPWSAAVSLVLEAQQEREIVAWITLPQRIFFPPDVVENGVDLEAVAVIRCPHPHGAARCAACLAQSGAFGVIVLDISYDARISMGLQQKLASLAKKHSMTIVCITRATSAHPSLGPMVSLRVEARREYIAFDQFGCHVHALKDKQGSPGWETVEVLGGPTGLH